MSPYSNPNLIDILMIIMWALIPTALYDASNTAEPKAY